VGQPQIDNLKIYVGVLTKTRDLVAPTTFDLKTPDKNVPLLLGLLLLLRSSRWCFSPY
jgi:hypothetical protein